MFLNHRSTQAEYFDEPGRPELELAEGYRMLGEMNRLFGLAALFKRFIPAWLGPDRCQNLTFLDIGGGDGSLGTELRKWAAERGWNWQFTTVDLNARALALGSPEGNFILASAMALPFKSGSYDVVMSSQTVHHLPDDQSVAQFFREAWRVSRDLVFINDLHRNLLLYSALWLIVLLWRYPKHFRSDALISVRKGWRLKEWRELAHRAGIPQASIRVYGGARILLHARKSACI